MVGDEKTAILNEALGDLFAKRSRQTASSAVRKDFVSAREAHEDASQVLQVWEAYAY